MPRHVKEANLSTREARKRLAVAHKPYFRSLDEGLHLGYRQSNSGTAWVVRWYKGDGTYGTKNLEGRPDDILAADGVTVLNWSQAQGKAREHFQQEQRRAQGLDETPAGPYTIKDALTDYMTAYKRKGGKAVDRMQWAIDALLLPSLGDDTLAKLTRRRIEQWHDGLAKTAPRLRTKPGDEQKFREVDGGADAIRRRRSSANRVLTILKAALNHAHHERKVASTDAWASVKAFREVDAARVRYLNDDEAKRLVNVCSAECKPLVQAALLTGCRYGELVVLTVADYNADAGTIHVRVSKSGKPRHVVLTDEGKTFFATMTAGKPAAELVFTKPSETLARIANLTGLDYHTVRGLMVSDFAADGDTCTLQVGGRTLAISSTAGKPIRRIADGRNSTDPLVPLPHFVRWGTSHQQRPFQAAVTKAKVGTLTFHELRHSYASRLVMAGAPLAVVAAQLGHSDTRMVEKHYGHLAPSYIADTVRATFTSMGVVEESNVVPLRSTAE